MEQVEVKVNSAKAWVLAARPKTLAAAVAPVLVGGALAYNIISGISFDFATDHEEFCNIRLYGAMKFALCLIFAILMQIDANFINDLYDFLKGTDGEDRLGPKRAMAQGWITKKAMYIGIAVTTLLGALSGLALLPMSENPLYLCIVGVLCILFAYSYSSGPFPLSYHGLGDIAVIAFFGITAVCVTVDVIVCTETYSPSSTLIEGIAVGMVVDTLLIVNNYRDRDTDRRDGKNTLVARFGERFGRLLYLFMGIGAVVLISIDFCRHYSGDFVYLIPFAYIPYILLHLRNYKKMKELREGKGLNVLIGESSKAMLLFALTSVLFLLLCDGVRFGFSV